MDLIYSIKILETEKNKLETVIANAGMSCLALPNGKTVTDIINEAKIDLEGIKSY